jgi:hypothetical protein
MHDGVASNGADDEGVGGIGVTTVRGVPASLTDRQATHTHTHTHTRVAVGRIPGVARGRAPLR